MVILSSSLRRLGLACIVPILSVWLVPAGAQAQFVTVNVRTSPQVAQPGDDVDVSARVAGCPPGSAEVEVYLTSDDGASVSAALMARGEARTSLLWRTKAHVELPDALEGWYGVRVTCGSFRPARVPMANTAFAVGANPTKESRILGTSVVEGGSLPLEGTGCPGTSVEYDIEQVELHTGPFIPEGTLPVAADGTWGAAIVFPIELQPGPVEVRSRCILKNRFGDTVYINYGNTTRVTVLRAPEGTLAPFAPGDAALTTTSLPA